MNWDDLRFLLAVQRGGTLAAAAKRLGVDQTTVARRLAGLESAAKTKLFLRSQGRLVATDLGEIAVAQAERVEGQILELEEKLTGGDASPEGKVRVTAVPVLAHRLLIPRLGDLLARCPKLELEIVAEPRNLSLSKRDADIAVRLARPEGGSALCRRLGTLSYSLYGAVDRAGEALPWLSYDDEHADLPQAKWLAGNLTAGDRARLRVNDAEGLFQAAAAGLGQALLSDALVGPALSRRSNGPVLTRDVWLLVHPDLRALPRFAAVIDWLVESFKAFESPLAPT